jgi:hypothetical protein
MGLGSGGSEKTYSGSRGQKGTVSRIRIRNTDLKTSCTVRYLGIGDQLIQLFVTDGVFALDVFH